MRKFLIPLLTLVIALGMVSTADAKAKKATPKFGKAGKFAAGLQTGLGGFGSGVGWHLNTTTVEAGGVEKDYDTSELVLNPTVDYFVIDGLSIGLQPAFGMVSQVEAETTMFGIAARVNYYHLLMGSLFLYGGGTFGIGSSTTDADVTVGGVTTAVETETGMKWFDIQAGALLAFGGKFGGFGSLALNYGIKWGNPDGPAEWTESGFGITGGLGVYF